jgi:hypothetical protein
MLEEMVQEFKKRRDKEIKHSQTLAKRVIRLLKKEEVMKKEEASKKKEVSRSKKSTTSKRRNPGSMIKPIKPIGMVICLKHKKKY